MLPSLQGPQPQLHPKHRRPHRHNQRRRPLAAWRRPLAAWPKQGRWPLSRGDHSCLTQARQMSDVMESQEPASGGVHDTKWTAEEIAEWEEKVA